MDRPIDEIAAELAGHGPNAYAAAVGLISALRYTQPRLDDAGRWQETLRILAAMDLVSELRVRGALGEYDADARG